MSDIVNELVLVRGRRRVVPALVALTTGVVSVLDAVVVVVPPASATAAQLSQVGAASTAGNRTGHIVRIPDTARSIDRLIVILSWSSPVPAFSPGTGWTQLQTRTDVAATSHMTQSVAVAQQNSWHATTGNDTVSLTTTDGGGRSSTTTRTVTVSP